EVLHNLEKGELDGAGQPKLAGGGGLGSRKNPGQLSLFVNEEDLVIHELRDMDTDSLTPLDALNRISVWKDRLKS
ncbi:MAG: hypothetical protein PHU03_04895, partial [Syntrophales bacterium]|nr:hypothetical protein [Syntrophales bacterium]